MTGIAAGEAAELGPAAENQGRRRAAGIYGAIITATILDTAGARVHRRELGAFANPKGRPRRKNSATGNVAWLPELRWAGTRT
jgi:hypothetical protein